MILYRQDDIGDGMSVSVQMNGRPQTLWQKEFTDQQLLDAEKAGWCSLETLRATQKGRQLRPKGRAGLV